MIELNSPIFWVVLAAAVALLVPLRSIVTRRLVLAAVNLLLVVLLLRAHALIVVAAVVTTYAALNLVERSRLRAVLASSVAAATAVLFVLHKRPEILEGLAGGAPLVRVLAAIGYSYVALRIVEVLRAVVERRHPAPDLAATVNYLLPFHMLAAGPIQSYDDFVRHAEDRFEPTPSDVLRGVERIASGLFKKLVLAHLLQTMFLTNLESSGWYFLLEMQLMFVWLFLDFSAYSDIASGVGILIGVATPENFNRPLLARNLVDFWERWHISLSLFIRRNIFIPLQMFLMRRDGGQSPLRAALVAVAVSFLLCGLWHGIGLGFLIWGAVQAGGLIVARVYGDVLRRRLGKAGVASYLANPWIRVAAIAITFEVQAVALMALVKA